MIYIFSRIIFRANTLVYWCICYVSALLVRLESRRPMVISRKSKSMQANLPCFVSCRLPLDVSCRVQLCSERPLSMARLQATHGEAPGG